MPGLVCAIGAEDAAAVVRRGAGTMCRRARHNLVVSEAPSDRVAVGFCGERGGVVRDEATGTILALDGELLPEDASRPAEGGARTLLDRYLAAGARLEVPEGWFAAAIWDPRRAELVLIADRFGQRPLYLARRGGVILAASELKALAAAGLEPELDLQAWAEMLVFEYPLDGSVPLAKVRLVPQASTLTVSRTGEEELRERWRYRVEPERVDKEAELVAELGRLLELAVLRRLGPRTGLALSAGLDSRSIAAVVSRLAPEVACFTYGAPGSEDLAGGTEIAARAGLAHRALPLEQGYIARGAAETVWLAEGHVRCFHAHHLALRPLREELGLREILMGFAGDVIMRGSKLAPPAEEAAFAAAVYESIAGCVTDGLLPEVFTERFAAELRGRAREAVARHLAREDGDPVARWRQFSFRHNRPRMLWGTELFRDDLTPCDPFHDRDLVDFCRRMPEPMRLDGRLQRAYLRQFPALIAVPSPKDGLPPALVGRRRKLAAAAVKVQRRGRALLEARLTYPWRLRSEGLGDYAHDLRLAGAELLGILLEPRTLARGQLRDEGVRRLVSETLSGRARHTRALGMLLTFELFQRQFLEGDRPES